MIRKQERGAWWTAQPFAILDDAQNSADPREESILWMGRSWGWRTAFAKDYVDGGLNLDWLSIERKGLVLPLLDRVGRGRLK